MLKVKSSIAIFASALLFVACGSKEKSPLLEGKLNVSEPTTVSVLYDYEGDEYLETLTTDSAGVFVYDPQLMGDEADVIVFVGSDFYGAHVKNGSTVKMNIDGDNVTFEGDDADKNNFISKYQSVYSPWNFKPTPAHPYNKEEWMARLEKGYQETKALLAAVADENARGKYEKLNEASRKYYEIQNLRLDKMMNNAEVDAQIDSIVATIDPNADESRLSGLLTYWYSGSDLMKRNSGTTYIEITPFFAGQIGAVDSVLTNEGNKKSLYKTLLSQYFMYMPSDSDIVEMKAAIAPQLQKAPKVAEMIQKVEEDRAKQVKNGDAFPTDPTIIARDGSKTTLAEVIKGKVAYIDFWATWCGPCCREIPYMEKVYERFKNNDKIVFVSVSQDDDRAAWEKKMDRDKPEWPNFIFEPKTGREFLDAMSIHSIPRFIIVGADGKIKELNAERPSNENIDAILNDAIAK